MIAQFDKDGVLHIAPETPLEEYALKEWVDHSMRGGYCDTERLVVSTRIAEGNP